MKNIAFKRAKHFDNMKDTLHPEFVVESADTSLFPEGFHKLSDGYEIVDEAQFAEIQSKNDELQQAFLRDKSRFAAEQLKIQEALARQAEVQERKDKKEYEEFLKWKKMRGK